MPRSRPAPLKSLVLVSALAGLALAVTPHAAEATAAIQDVAAAPQQASVDWKNVDGSLEKVSADDQNVWGVNAGGEIYRRPLDGSGAWQRIAGGLADISASGLGWIWGVNAGGEVWRCGKPCAPDGSGWVRVDGWPNADDRPVQVSADETHVWAVSGNGTIHRRPVDGSGTWESVRGEVQHLTASGDGLLWAVQSDGRVWKCDKPCTGDWKLTGGWRQDDVIQQVSAGATYLWAVTRTGAIWRRLVTGSGDWEKICCVLSHVAGSPNGWVWGVQDHGSIWKARLGSAVASATPSTPAQDPTPAPTPTPTPTPTVTGPSTASSLTIVDDSNIHLAAHRTETGDDTSQNPDITGGAGGYPAGFDPYATGASFGCCGTDHGPGNLRDHDIGSNFAYGRYSDGLYAIPTAGQLALEIGRARTVTGVAIYNGYTNRDDGTYRLLDGSGRLLGAWSISTPPGAGTNEGAHSFWLQFKRPVTTDKLLLQTTSSDADGTNSYREIVVYHAGPSALRGITIDDVHVVSWAASPAWSGEMASGEGPGHLVNQGDGRWLHLNGDRQVMATYEEREKEDFVLLLEGDNHLLDVDYDRIRIEKRHPGGAVRWTRKIHEVSRIPDDTDYARYVPAVTFTAKGHDVTHVTYGDDQAVGVRRNEGYFEQLPDKGWVHMGRHHPHARALADLGRFSETGRDEWSVYLTGTSATNEGVRVVLNLWQRTVTSGAGATQLEKKVTGASNEPLPTAAELAQMAEIRRQEESADYDRHLMIPISTDDLNEVMRWIGEEAAAGSVDFCYKNSSPRPGYPWQSGDPPLPSGYPVMIERCEGNHGDGQCYEDAGVVYPECRAGYDGVGPICFQSCPKLSDAEALGQSISWDCGAFCGATEEACALGVKDMVFAPINLALNILSLGLAGAAQNASAKVATQAVDASLDAVQSAAVWGNAAATTTTSATAGGAFAVGVSTTAASAASPAVARATLGSVLKEGFKFGAQNLADDLAKFSGATALDFAGDVIQIAGESQGVISSLSSAGQSAADAASVEATLSLVDDVALWSVGYARNFRSHTNGRIERIIDRHFTDPDDRAYIKQKFAHYQLMGMIEADGWEVGKKVLGALSFEPTGILSLVDAFAHPVCRDAPVPFPDIRVLPAAERTAFDPWTRAMN